MHCPSCKNLIEDVATDVAGVQSCSVDPTTATGIIVHDETFNFSDFEKEIAGLEKYKVEKI